MPEPTLANLMTDLNYIIQGTYVHEFLLTLFPPRGGAKILEPGCGSSKFTVAYALKDCQTWAIDIDPEVIKYAKRLAKALDDLTGGFLYPPIIKLGDIHHLDFPDNAFELVFNEGVPQHWPDEERRQGAINEMARVSRDMVIIIGNNGLNPREQEVDRTFQFGYFGMPPTRRCFTPDELGSRMRSAGLVDISVVGIGGTLDNTAPSAVLLAGYGRKK